MGKVICRDFYIPMNARIAARVSSIRKSKVKLALLSMLDMTSPTIILGRHTYVGDKRLVKFLW